MGEWTATTRKPTEAVGCRQKPIRGGGGNRRKLNAVYAMCVMLAMFLRIVVVVMMVVVVSRLMTLTTVIMTMAQNNTEAYPETQTSIAHTCQNIAIFSDCSSSTSLDFRSTAAALRNER